MAVEKNETSAAGNEEQLARPEILSRLSDDPLSAETIKAFLEQIDDLAPHLRELVTNARATTVEIWHPFRHALFILAGAHDAQTCQTLLAMMRREGPENTLLEYSCDNQPQIIASVFDGDADTLFALACDRSVEQEYRGWVISAATYLTWKGKISRDSMHEFLSSLAVTNAFDPEIHIFDPEIEVVETWIMAIALLGMDDLAPLVYRRMATRQFGDLIPDRPHFDHFLNRARKDPGDPSLLEAFDLGEISDVAAALYGDTDVPSDDDELDDDDQDDDELDDDELDDDELDDDELNDDDQDDDGLDDDADDDEPVPFHVLEKIVTNLTTAAYTQGDILTKCLKRLPEIGPFLRGEVERAVVAETLSEDDAIAVCRCIYVLAADRDSRTCRLMLRLLQRPEPAFRRVVEGIYPDLSDLVINLFDWDAESLFSLIADASIEMQTRCNLLDAAAFLTFEGKILRERMLRFLTELDVHTRHDEDDEHLIECWIFAIGLLGMSELTPLVKKRVDVGDFDDLGDSCDDDGILASLLDDAEKLPYNPGRFWQVAIGIGFNVSVALSKHPDPRISSRPPPQPKTVTRKPRQAETPVVNPWRDVGRNDPCPCGSGRKAKKCCLANK